ncbi:hypothetical protein BU15DRAFT_26455, partial [Melanogaster broomeanus]
KKRQRASDNESIGPKVDDALPKDSEKASKKRKRHHKGDSGAAHEEITEPSRKQKEHRCHHDLPFPDPSSDGSLDKQNRKALSYAYDRLRDPKSWKFNKARQNWLIRNVWSETAIPDNYVPLLTKYLADIKGGARQKLIDSCNSKISPIVVAPMEGAQPHDSTNAEDSSATSHPTVSRAHSLLQAL